MKEVYTFADLENWAALNSGGEVPLRLSVFGEPVAHSASPQMHNAALEHCGIAARYCRLRVTPEELEGALRLLPEKGFLGTNLTIPHKAAALSLMDDVDERARKIGAVNTVVVDGGRLAGFNTDGPGLVKAIRAEFSVDLRDLRVLILGAGGGAGRAVAVQCALEGCERLVLTNRTAERADELAKELRPHFSAARVAAPVERIESVPWDPEQIRRQLENIDLVINATSIGMKRTDPELLPASMLMPHLMVYDTIYTSAKTKLLQAADEAGARGANGLSMLLYQGALSFEIWFNREAPLEVMRSALIRATSTA